MNGNGERIDDETPEGEEYEAGESSQGQERTPVDLQIVKKIHISQNAKISKIAVMAGKRKTVKIELIMAYDTENTADLNDSIGEYASVTIDRIEYREESEEEKDELNQLRFEFEEEVGA